MENKNGRQSNIELLRIIAMLMIISYHIIIHCVNIQLTNTVSIERLQNGWFNTPDFYNQLLMLALMMPLGLVGNAIFIMISGYFLADREIDMLKVSKKLLSQLNEYLERQNMERKYYQDRKDTGDGSLC